MQSGSQLEMASSNTARLLALPSDVDGVELIALIHKVQRERGVSCGWVASGGGGPFWEEGIRTCRDESDAVLSSTAFGGTWVGDELRSIRADADEAVAHAREGAPSPTVDGGWLAEGAAAEDFSRLAAAFYSCFSKFNALLDLLLDEPKGRSSHGAPDGAAASDAFARLKEATGIERAFLCGALALPATALPLLPSRAFADLVIGLQQQRAFEAAVRAAAPPRLLELIRAGFTLSPSLRDVQEKLLRDFDLVSLRETLTAERAWRLMTEQIDKLESLQIILHAQLRRELSEPSRAEPSLPAPVAPAAAHPPLCPLCASLLGSRLDALLDGLGLVDQGLDPAVAQQLKQRIRRVSALVTSVLVHSHQHREPSLSSRGPSPVATPPAGTSPRRLHSPDEPVKLTCSPPARGSGAPGPAAAPGPLEPPTSLRVSLDALAFQRRIGAGAAGTTYLAEWDRPGEEGKLTVAVKVAGGGAADLDSWRKEVQVLTRLRHPNIVRCLGVLYEPPTTHGLVLEYCAGLDLLTALGQATPPGFVLRTASGLAAGMTHLHEQGLLHRDLKSANVLLDQERMVKVTDFGLAAHAPDGSTASWLTAETGTYRWMAPEVIRHERYSRSADVYSYAMILFELLTREQPFAPLTPIMAGVESALNSNRPHLPSGLPAQIDELVRVCWDAAPERRPSFEDIERRLRELPAELGAAGLEYLDAPRGHPVYSTPAGGAAAAPATGAPAGAPAESGASRARAVEPEARPGKARGSKRHGAGKGKCSVQ